jgi:hypothetical protein
MVQRLFSYTSLASAILAVVTLVFLLSRSDLSPSKDRISLTPELHVGVLHNFTQSSLVVFDNLEFGPVFNAVTGVADADGRIYSFVDRDTAWHRFGIYLRQIERRDGITCMTFAVSLYYFLLLFAFLPSIWILRHWRQRVLGQMTNRHRSD